MGVPLIIVRERRLMDWENIQNSDTASEEPWNLFLDYGGGILYKVAEKGVSLEKVAKAERCINVDEFCRKLQSSVKKKTR